MILGIKVGKQSDIKAVTIIGEAMNTKKRVFQHNRVPKGIDIDHCYCQIYLYFI